MAFETLTQTELDSMKIQAPVVEKPSAEEIAQHYKAALDSVALLDAGKPKEMSDEDWADTVKRNKEHLEIQLEKGAEFYGDLDLTPFKDAVK